MRTKFVIFSLVIALILGACGATTEVPATNAPIVTDTAAPVLPTQPSTAVVPLAILVVPTTLDPETSNLYQKNSL